MSLTDIAFLLSGLIIIYYIFDKKRRIRKKEQFIYIKNYKFPPKVGLEVKKAYPHLSDIDIQTALKGLRDYFYISKMSANDEIVGMPSQVVDVAWHEFILFTKEYALFCQNAFGKFHHHIPAEAMKSKNDAQFSIRVAWRYACKKEYIYMRDPTKLPLLFAIDSMLKIEDGFHYTLNCKENSDAFCVKNIGSTGKSGCGGCGGAGCGGHHTGCSGDSGCGGGCGGCGG